MSIANIRGGSKERLDYIDALRGATMIMVVYWHLLTMAMNISSPAGMTLQLFRMPLFFFISGFFAYSFLYDREKLHRRLDNRLHKQLIPTLLIFILFILFDISLTGDFADAREFLGSIPDTLIGSAASEFKSGYWFTFVLVEVFAVFAPVNYLFSSRGTSRSRQGLAFLAIAILGAGAGWLCLSFPPQKGSFAATLCGAMSMSHLMRYLPFFFLGAATRAFDTRLWKLLSRKWAAVLIIAATVGALWATPRFRTPIPLFYAAACCGILLCITLFFICRRFFEKKNPVSESLKFIGKNTLPIYLFHYFVIRAMKEFDLSGMISLVKGNSLVEIPLLLAAALLIVATVLGIDSLLRKERHIYRFIFSV